MKIVWGVGQRDRARCLSIDARAASGGLHHGDDDDDQYSQQKGSKRSAGVDRAFIMSQRRRARP